MQKNSELMESNDLSFDNGYILSAISSVFNSKLKDILTQISSDYSLNKDKLISKYVQNDNISMNIDIVQKRKRKKNKQLTGSELCMARKADNDQCTRRRKENSEYCGKHCNNLKFGRIDDEDKYSNSDDFIKCSPEEIDGKEYLVDSLSGIVYCYDFDNPKIVGKKNSEGKLVLIEDIKFD